MGRDLTTSSASHQDPENTRLSRASWRLGDATLPSAARLLAAMALGALVLALVYQIPVTHIIDIGGMWVTASVSQQNHLVGDQFSSEMTVWREDSLKGHPTRGSCHRDRKTRPRFHGAATGRCDTHATRGSCRESYQPGRTR